MGRSITFQYVRHLRTVRGAIPVLMRYLRRHMPATGRVAGRDQAGVRRADPRTAFEQHVTALQAIVARAGASVPRR
jgi:hypothetical protein